MLTRFTDAAVDYQRERAARDAEVGRYRRVVARLRAMQERLRVLWPGHYSRIQSWVGTGARLQVCMPTDAGWVEVASIVLMAPDREPVVNWDRLITKADQATVEMTMMEDSDGR